MEAIASVTGTIQRQQKGGRQKAGTEGIISSVGNTELSSASQMVSPI
ncbi:hypothetical protein DSM107010_17360 [Chroococcidiopsis cubana SAG 39.79]|uniref:CsbD-like domain-containing protein n=1 Tax=Chroococcidiopsis cubana SAG 39.79 TaxID=388085 RepID=A0AB37UND6_9CYAN|nr:hypothetical protein DSM107010_17360 [Chroococcidiopsis cubana SAG 39.79]